MEVIVRPGAMRRCLTRRKMLRGCAPCICHPSFTRRGVGRLILTLCEDAARGEGFTRVELMATMAGEPLYRACGFEAVEEVVENSGGAGVPLLRMRKAL